MWTVFLSSTSVDLAPYRDAVHRAVSDLDGFHCIWMEGFGARDAAPLDLITQKVRECDLFVGILGWLHGSCPSGNQLSFTEIEYDAAVAYGRPRLVFVTPESFPMQGNLRENDQKWQRQRDFRERVSRERVRATFFAPDSLASEVIKAIRNWERSKETRAEARSAGTAAEAAPDLGPLVCKMCDREPQETQFKANFGFSLRERKGLPQVYVLCGEERECPESLVERLTKLHLCRHASQIAGENKGAVAIRRVAWPEVGELDERYQRLIANLFDSFDPGYEMAHEDLSPAGFALLEPLHVSPIVILAARGESGLNILS
ncbi:MAG TPA: DUF4062 domain-containing protein [Thermoanaerobaculia bacterium]|nr:DUF4062 domain-containing protein [Thermoanaerobaculia bacterium]